jgi:predicted nucleotidyltransferase
MISQFIPGIPEPSQQRLIQLLASQLELQAVWLFGSRAMGSEQPGSDLDLCLEAPQLGHSDRLRLLNAVDDLCLPWQVDLVLRHELPADLEAHVQRVGRCLWTAASQTATPKSSWPSSATSSAFPGLR